MSRSGFAASRGLANGGTSLNTCSGWKPFGPEKFRDCSLGRASPIQDREASPFLINHGVKGGSATATDRCNSPEAWGIRCGEQIGPPSTSAQVQDAVSTCRIAVGCDYTEVKCIAASVLTQIVRDSKPFTGSGTIFQELDQVISFADL